jgi:hypothetical protein
MFAEFHNINKQQSTKWIRVLTIVGFLFFFGLRGFVYTDWYNYYPYFNGLPKLWEIGSGTFQYEIGFELYSIFIKSIWNNYFFWIFISSLIDACLLHVFFKRYSKYYVLGIIIFVVFHGFIIEINLLRNIKAMLLFLLSLRYIKEQKIIPFLLLNILAISFHLSAIVYIPAYFLLHREYSKKILWAIFLIGNIVFLAQLEYIAPIFNFLGNMIGGKTALKTSLYLHDNFYSKPYGFSLGYFERIFTYIVVMACYNKLLKQNKTNIIFINAYVLYFFVFFFCSEMTVITQRVPLLFVFSYWILYSRLYELIALRKAKLVFLSLFTLYSILKLGGSNQDIFSKYDNIIFGIQKYEERKFIFQKYSTITFKK